MHSLAKSKCCKSSRARPLEATHLLEHRKTLGLSAPLCLQLVPALRRRKLMLFY